jgi:hypothetical protein
MEHKVEKHPVVNVPTRYKSLMREKHIYRHIKQNLRTNLLNLVH